MLHTFYEYLSHKYNLQTIVNVTNVGNVLKKGWILFKDYQLRK